MIKKICSLFLFLLLSLSSCQTKIIKSSPLQSFLTDFSDEVNIQRNLTFVGSYEEGDPLVDTISLYYSGFYDLPLSDARRFSATMIHQFLLSINNNLEVKPQLEGHEFKVDQLDLVLFFRDKEGVYSAPPNIAQVTLQKGVLNYYTYSDEEFHLVEHENYSSVNDHALK